MTRPTCWIRTVTSLLLVATFVVSPRQVLACQNHPPPAQVTCQLSVDVACAELGTPFSVHFTVTNVSTNPPFPPPWQDDLAVTLVVDATLTSIPEENPEITQRKEGADGDFVWDWADNCPFHFNPAQEDGDSDGVGDACDNCPLDPNSVDSDSDGQMDDNGPDGDSDGIGDACDMPGGDADGDTILDDADNCPTHANAGQEDTDSDGPGDVCDNCPEVDNSGQENDDSDPHGNACDNCPDHTNPLQDDADSDGTGDRCDPDECFFNGPTANPLSVTPASVDIVLDEMGSPFADDPTTWTQEFVVTPPTELMPDDAAILITARATAPTGGWLCWQTICLPICDTTEGPAVSFADPEQTGDAGSPVDFQLQIDRRDTDPDAPLEAQVILSNPFDVLDVFPIDPPELATGVPLAPGDQTIEFSCGLHGPCYVGMMNQLHVVLRNPDTDEVVLDTRVRHPSGIGHAVVSRAPIALQKVLEIDDDGGDGRLSACEHGFIRLLVMARNPWLGTELRDVVLETDLPDGLTVVEATLHHHDNPLDMVDPTDMELEATGVINQSPGLVQATTSTVLARFADDSMPEAPAVFLDLFELELLLETPPEGLGAVTDITFPGARVQAMVEGSMRDETSPPIVIPIMPADPPVEVSGRAAPQPLVFNDVETLFWEPASGPTESFNLYRGEITGLHRGDEAACHAAGLIANSATETEAPTDGLGWYYLVSGRNCAFEGPLGSDSFGDPRTTADVCP